nr:glycosyltransferase family 39 protein [Bacillus sp. FJAT-27916]
MLSEPNYFDMHLYSDDLRYEDYAKTYTEIANNILDLDAFQTTDIKFGGVTAAALYFRINAVIYYLFNSVIVLRLFNILIASFTIFPIYFLAKELFNEKVAKISAFLYCCIPYYIIFSSFLFKDSLLMLLITLSLVQIIKFYKYKKYSVLKLVIPIILMHWIRFGVGELLIGIFILALINREQKNTKNIKIIRWIITIVVIGIIMMLLLFSNYSGFLNKIEIYSDYARDYQGPISFFRVDNIFQLYKLPFAWALSVILPLNFDFNVNKWSDVLSLLNYLSVFILPAFLIYWFTFKKNKLQKIILYPLLLLHLFSAATVINVPRHFYFLHFFIIICSSAYLSTLKDKRKILFIITVLLMYVLLFLLNLILIN